MKSTSFAACAVPARAELPGMARLGQRAYAAIVGGCAAVASAWRYHDELLDMLQFDDRLLHDIGVRRSEILAAIHERRWTRAAWRLIATAIVRRPDAPMVKI